MRLTTINTNISGWEKVSLSLDPIKTCLTVIPSTFAVSTVTESIIKIWLQFRFCEILYIKFVTLLFVNTYSHAKLHKEIKSSFSSRNCKNFLKFFFSVLTEIVHKQCKSTALPVPPSINLSTILFSRLFIMYRKRNASGLEKICVKKKPWLFM